jgi:hypothetical protein
MTNGRVKKFYFLETVQTGSQEHSACYSKGTEALSSSEKQPGSDYSSPPSAEGKNDFSFTSSLPLAFTACTGTTLASKANNFSFGAVTCVR